MPTSQPKQVDLECVDADTFAIMGENDDVQMLGVLDQNGEYTEASELNKVGQNPASTSENQIAKMPETELKRSLMQNLRSKRDERNRQKIKKSIQDVQNGNANNMAYTMFELQNQKVIDTYHSVKSRLGFDLPPFHIEYDKKYFYFTRCIFKRDCENTQKRRKMPISLLYKCRNSRCVGLLKYLIEKKEMYKLRDHSQFCNEGKTTHYYEMIRADLDPDFKLADSVYINEIFLKVIEQEMDQPFSFEPSVSIWMRLK